MRKVDYKDITIGDMYYLPVFGCGYLTTHITKVDPKGFDYSDSQEAVPDKDKEVTGHVFLDSMEGFILQGDEKEIIILAREPEKFAANKRKLERILMADKIM